MASIEVITYPLTNYAALAEAFRQLNEQGWTGQIRYAARGPNEAPEYYMVVDKAGQSAVLTLGDSVVSLGGGVVMTQEQYDTLFGGQGS